MTDDGTGIEKEQEPVKEPGPVVNEQPPQPPVKKVNIANEHDMNTHFYNFVAKYNGDYHKAARALFMDTIVLQEQLKLQREVNIQMAQAKVIPPLADDEVCVIMSHKEELRRQYRDMVTRNVRARLRNKDHPPLYILAAMEDKIYIVKRNRIRVQKDRPVVVDG